MNLERLKKLETNKEIIDKYVANAAFGKNRIVYLPLVIGIGLLFFVAYAIFDNLVHVVGNTILIVLGIIALLCFIAVKLIANAAAKKLKETTFSAPVCIAKKILGNESAEIFYCIYTTDEKRHDVEFIDRIAENIHSILPNTQENIEREVLSLFKTDFANANEFAKKLPLSFTANVTVWRKQFSFIHVPKEIKNDIISEDGKFVTIAINPENARFFNEYYSK